MDAYCRRTGRGSIPNWGFFLAFSIFRVAAIVQGVYKRGLDGNAASARAQQYGELVRERARAAWQLARG